MIRSLLLALLLTACAADDATDTVSLESGCVGGGCSAGSPRYTPASWVGEWSLSITPDPPPDCDAAPVVKVCIRANHAEVMVDGSVDAVVGFTGALASNVLIGEADGPGWEICGLKWDLYTGVGGLDLARCCGAAHYAVVASKVTSTCPSFP